MLRSFGGRRGIGRGGSKRDKITQEMLKSFRERVSISEKIIESK